MNPSSNQLNATQFLQTYLTPRSEVIHCAEEIFQIPLSYVNFFSSYFLLKYKGDYLFSQLEGSKGILIKDDIPYSWRLLRGLSLGKIAMYPNEQYLLSFRKAIPQVGISPIVLITSETKLA